MTLRFATALVVALSAGPPAFAAAPMSEAGSPHVLEGSVEACAEAAARHPQTSFEVVVGTYPTTVEFGMTIKQINRLRGTDPPPKVIAHGLSIADYRLRYTVKSEATCWQPGGHTCVWLGSLAVNLTPDDVRIYIPKEYKRDSCESKALLRHEREHEKQHRLGVERLAELMRLALARAKNLPGPTTPIHASNPEEAYASVKAQVDEVVRPIYEEFLKSSKQDQVRLDTPETYRELGEACSGWMKI